jgi:uncharacterized membrane protein
MNRLKRFFITTLIGGVVVLLPISILVFVIRFLINLISGGLKPISAMLGDTMEMNKVFLDLIAFTIVILFCFLVGLFIRTQIGKTSFKYIESTLLSRIPFYDTVKDIVQQFTGNKKTPFKQVVLADVFNNSTLMTGFVTDDHGNGMFTIFVPTAPNPTNGFVFHVHKDHLKFVDKDAQEAMRSVIGMGAGSLNLFEEEE